MGLENRYTASVFTILANGSQIHILKGGGMLEYTE